MKFVAPLTTTMVFALGHAPATTAPAKSVHVQFAGSFTLERSPAPVQSAVIPPMTSTGELAVVSGMVSVTAAEASQPRVPVPELANTLPVTLS